MDADTRTALDALARDWDTQAVIRAEDHAVMHRCAQQLRALLAASPAIPFPEPVWPQDFIHARCGKPCRATHGQGPCTCPCTPDPAAPGSAP